MSVWDDPDLKPPADDFVKLDNKGDTIGGLITAVRSHRFNETDTAPQISYIDKVGGTNSEKVWTAGQLQSKRKLAELRPEPGEEFTATLVEIEKRAGGKTLKHIDIDVFRGTRTAPWSSVPAATPAAPAADAAPADAPPPGVDRAVWDRMDVDSRSKLSAAMGVTARYSQEPPF